MQYFVYYTNKPDIEKFTEKNYFYAGLIEEKDNIEFLRRATCTTTWIRGGENRFMRIGDVVRIGEHGDRFMLVKGGLIKIIEDDDDCQVKEVIDYGKMLMTIVHSQYDP